MPLKIDDYEAFMQEQELIFPNLKDAEYDGFPPVAEVFDADPQVPQHRLWLNYWMKHVKRFDEHPTVLPGLMARVYRMYPSLVREYHCYLLLQDRGAFDLVLRGRELDQKGVDYLILQDGAAFGVAAYIDTPRSKMFRGRKKVRHKPLGVTVELPLLMDESETVGPFNVYGQKHLDYLWGHVKNHLAN